MKDTAVRTYQTRPSLSPLQEEILQACADLFAHIEHSLFADICKGKVASQLKSDYLVKYGITARQFNAIRVNVEGKIDSLKELRKQAILDLREKIESLKRKISKLQKKPSLFHLVHQKKRRLHTLQEKLKRLVKEQDENKLSICFGSKKLFRAQFNLEANGYATHQEWLDDWRQVRTSEIFFLGSKDETSGNQTCQANMEEGTLTLHIRLPNALHEKYGKYLTISHIAFAYGQEEIQNSLIENQHRQHLAQAKDASYRNYGQALTYRFKCDKKSWRLFVSTTLPTPQWKTKASRGVIGIDINTDHLALVETDRFGNPIHKQTIPLNLYGKTKEQSRAIIGDAAARVVEHAEQTLKPLVLENLDFQKKKQTLREESRTSYSRMLSSFSYQAIITHLKSRAFGSQVEVVQVNPAFTSLIGRVKFASRYGLSIHHAAALCIGRRFLKFSEQVPRHMDKIPDGKGAHVALTLPVRNRDKHVWHLWGLLKKKLLVALAAHFRAKRSSSTCKAAPETKLIPNFANEILACESSAQLLG
jgi:IS605 OrfB family transposase